MVDTSFFSLNEQPVATNDIILPAPAKLNLFLHIVGQRSDGYHNLQTLFQLLDFSDQLHFKKREADGISFSCTDRSLETPDNLILKAARRLEEHSGQRFNLSIHLDKKLPMGGGIGGGSSDCATTLLALNHMYDLNFSEQELADLGSSLGADVPVFIKGRTAWAEGIGEQLTPMQTPEDWYLVIYPNVHVSTPALFAHPQLTRDTPVSTISPSVIEQGHNDFEPLVRALYASVDQAFLSAAAFGQPRLTGTGSCLFLKMASEVDALQALNSMNKDQPNLSAFMAKATNLSPAKVILDKLTIQ